MCNPLLGGRGVCAGRFRLRIWTYSLLAMLLAIPLGLHAQQYSGTITGSVTDASGAAIPGATVTAINTGTSNKVTQKSGGQGEFTFAQLAVGTYEVHVTQGNFKEYVETGVEVHTSTVTEVKAMLQVGAVSQKVTVTAEAVQVQTTSAAVGEVVSVSYLNDHLQQDKPEASDHGQVLVRLRLFNRH